MAECALVTGSPNTIKMAASVMEPTFLTYLMNPETLHDCYFVVKSATSAKTVSSFNLHRPKALLKLFFSFKCANLTPDPTNLCRAFPNYYAHYWDL